MSRKSKRKQERRAEAETAGGSSTHVRSSLPDDRGWSAGGTAVVETAPSLLRKEEPTFARFVGLLALGFLVFGTALQLLTWNGYRGWFDPGWAYVCIPLGIAGMLFHAAADSEQQVRRLYGLLGGILLVLGAVVCILPALTFLAALLGITWDYPAKHFPPILFGYGLLFLLLAMVLLLFFTRHETEQEWRERSMRALGGAGAALALSGFIAGIIWKDFLAPYGLILALVGLGYLWCFIKARGTLDPTSYRIGQVIGLSGLFLFIFAIGRTIFPPLFYAWRWISESPEPYFVPYGLCLMLCGVLYGGFAIGLYSDRPVVVMTRRELASFFYSPIAYLVLLGMTVVGVLMYGLFLYQMFSEARGGGVLQEPIVRNYILSLVPVICVIFIVPALTMRLLSEEQRSGTLEVLLTAPVGEWSVVLSKFFAAWLFYQLIWVPWGLLLIGLCIENGSVFEYRPLLGFFLVQLCTGAGFIAIGMFCSCVTRNQIIALVLTFAAMLLSVLAYLVEYALTQLQSAGFSTGPWAAILAHVNFIDLWITALGGALSPRALLFHLCVAVFWLFVTVKVLESRKWR